jgi:hypothetical protein
MTNDNKVNKLTGVMGMGELHCAWQDLSKNMAQHERRLQTWH